MQVAGTEFRVSEGSLGEVLRLPEAVMAPDGKVLLAYHGMRLLVQRADAEGTENLFSISAEDLGIPGLNRGFAGSDIAVQPDGSFAVAFVGYTISIMSGRTTADSKVFVQTFNAAGATMGTPREIADWPAGQSGNIARNTRIEAVDGGYVLTYTAPPDPVTFRDQTFLQRLGADGRPQGDAVSLVPSGNIDILAQPGGGALLAWLDRGSLYTQVMAGDGSVTPVATVATGLTSNSQNSANHVELLGMSDGRIFALFETSPGAGARPGLHLQQLDAGGRAVGSAVLAVPGTTAEGVDITFRAPASTARSRFDLAELPGGLIALAYGFAPEGGRATDYDVAVVAVRPDGSMASDAPQVLTLNTSREQSQPYLLAQADGSVMLVFYDERPATFGGRNEMRAVRLTAPDPDAPPQDLLLRGTDGDDTLVGGPGNDDIAGGPGNDLLEGWAGNDIIWGGAGRDTIYGGDGNDTIYGGGNQGPNQLFGDAGDDLIFAGSSGDAIYGGDGNDTIRGAESGDFLYGGDGNDNIGGGGGNDLIFGGEGNNIIWGGEGNDTIRGGSGNDTIYGGPGNDNLAGGAGDDEIYGSAGNNIMWGGFGSDTIAGADGRDTIYGGGTAGTNQLFGNAGDDLIFAGDGGDFIGGGAGNDTIRGGAGADTIYGGLGDDDIGGGAGNDEIFAVAGSNVIWGGVGNDTIHAGTGRDVMNGGPGADVFVFASAAHIGIGANRDVISDFQTGIDRIDLSALNTQFNGSAGVLGGGVASFYFFAAGGLLIGDQTGNGAADWVLQLTGATSVLPGDFIL